MDIQGILFDKDGTLLEFEKTWRPIANMVVEELLQKYHLEEGFREQLEESIGLFHDRIDPNGSLSSGTNREVALDFFRVLLQGGVKGLDEQDFISSSTAIFNKIAGSMPFYAIPGVLPLLLTLREAGVKIGLSTADSVENATLFLEKSGLLPYVDYIGADDGIVEPKPAPEYMERFCQQYGLSPSQVVVIGDTLVDMNFGKASAAGLIIGVLSGTGDRELLSSHTRLILDDVTKLFKDNHFLWEDL